MADYTFDHKYDVPTDKVLDLLRDAEVDNRTQEQICEGFVDSNKVVFEFEIVPCHLKMKSKIIRLKKSVKTIDKLSMNRTYLRQADYKALHERVIKQEVQRSTAGAIAVRVANLTESLDSDIYVHDIMYGLDKVRSVYILSVEIRGCDLDVLRNEDMHNFIGDVLQQTVFNVNVLLDRALMVKPVTIVKQ